MAIKKSLIIFLSLSACLLGHADIFSDLVCTVVDERDSLSQNEISIPADLEDIVNSYYSEAIVSDSVPANVLSYIASIYTEHGYHDSGAWLPRSRKKPGSGSKYSRYVPYTGKLPTYNETDFQIPVNGPMTSSFGYRRQYGRFHFGVDIALQTGDTVKCVLPGVVTKTGYDSGGYGRYIIVTHSGNLETLYGHLHKAIAKPGDKISAGQALGLGGATGNASGPHLHFETRYNGIPYNPLSWLKSQEGFTSLP